MTQPNFDDDRTLVAFFKQHQPVAPPPAPDLQQRLIAQLDPQLHVGTSKTEGKRQRSRHKLWLIPTAIAASLAVVWVGNRQMQPSLSEADRLEIEQFLVSSWSMSVDESVEDVVDPYSSPELATADDRVSYQDLIYE